MKLSELADRIGARIVTNARRAGHIEIDRICAGDQVSDLLNEATDGTLLVTNLANPLLPRVANLMDVPAVCLLNGTVPDPRFAEVASELGTVLVVSPLGMDETRGCLERCLQQQDGAQ